MLSWQTGHGYLLSQVAHAFLAGTGLQSAEWASQERHRSPKTSGVMAADAWPSIRWTLLTLATLSTACMHGGRVAGAAQRCRLLAVPAVDLHRASRRHPRSAAADRLNLPLTGIGPSASPRPRHRPARHRLSLLLQPLGGPLPSSRCCAT